MPLFPGRKRSDTAERLLDVAVRVFAAHGYDETTVDKVAREAGVSRPMLYEHFPSKEALLLACVRRERDLYMTRLAEELEGVTDLKELIRAGGDSLYRYVEEDPNRWVVLFGGAVPAVGYLGGALWDLRKETVAQIAFMIGSGVDPNTPPETLQAAAHAISGIGEQLGLWWVDNPTIPRERVVDLYVDLIWGGVQPLVG